MADGDLLVTISGAALSLLFYENVRSPGDQMGFLLGETLEFVVKTYTDSDNQVETVKIHNNIQTVVTCPLPDILHDSTGRINKEKLKDFVHDKNKQVIGWFRFRQNTSLVPTMRDKLLHKEFAAHFSGGNGSKEEFFVTCLLSSSTSDMRGTHKFRHVFLRHRRGVYEPIPLRINNLGVDSFRHDGSDYKPTPTKKLSDMPDVFSNLIDSLNLDVTRLGGLESAITIQKAAEQYLDRLIPEMCESDLEVAELEKQVRELRANHMMRKLSRKLKVNGTSETTDPGSEGRTDNPVEDVRIAELSPSKMKVSDNICNETQLVNDQPMSTSQTIGIQKTRNTNINIAQTVSQEKSKKSGLSSDGQSNPKQETLVNTVSEVKLDVVDGVMARSRRIPNAMSEITKDSISKEQSDSPSKGRVKSVYEHNTGMKRPRRTVASTATRSSTSDRSSYSQLSEQEPTESSSFRSTSPTIGSRKSVNSTRSSSDLADNH